MRVSGHHGSHELPEEPAAEAAAASVTRSTSNHVPLTKANERKIKDQALNLLDSEGFRSKHLSGMPLGVEFASFVAKVSGGRPITVLVPQGPLVPDPKLKHDPNQAKEFYLGFAPSPGHPKHEYFGPFKIK